PSCSHITPLPYLSPPSLHDALPIFHDYFFAKTIDKVRAGGIIAFITSNGISGGTMDKKDAHAREYMARRCDLLGAVRLPNTTFRDRKSTRLNSSHVSISYAVFCLKK